ncbi:sulfatase-like hydrolase/transferase [Flavobacterium psychrotrophum]|uniref:sulfatase-like hydrolase/transferase n=1 Tax=Flavobacterium psychrotrophum TaxID=2294119 RepID=UPI000E3182D0|nr:sulfatase-like hydrolase/transferase [Flavobacterium psychrotrophum]
MIEKLRLKIVNFITSPKDVPLLAGIAIGLYMIIYYYSKNLALAASWSQFLFFVGYYLALPVVVLFTGYKIAKLTKYKKHFLFIVIAMFIAYYLLELSFLGDLKRYIFGGVILLSIVLSLRFSGYYKLFVVLLLFLSLFNLAPLVTDAYAYATSSDAWTVQPDGILTADFKQKPNIYYIQPDGYASKENLDGVIYHFDNAEFETYLKQTGFTTYTNYRSNYYSTLLSNSSMFSMKHHYLQGDVEKYNARNIIMGNNAVLQTLKHNGYKTHFITERPYLLMSRPDLGYDTANFSYTDLPYLKDAWDLTRDVVEDFKNMKPAPGSHFYFFERMVPGHISVFNSKGKEEERRLYLEGVKQANIWLKQLISEIEKKDPDGIIVIAADHGGFVGFETSLQSQTKTDNPLLVKSMYGALCTIKWGDKNHTDYDANLKTSVNLFRVVFANLSEDKALLKNLQEDDSYIDAEKPKGIYRYIDAGGNVVFQKKE